MIDIRQASEKSIAHLNDLFINQDLGQIVLEEAELTADDQFWLVTLSFDKTYSQGGVGESVFAGNRCFKVFKLHAETGEVKSMKNRTSK